MIKKILVLLACVLPLTVFAQDLKVGYYNRVNLIQSMPEYTEATKKLDQLSQDYEKEVLLIQEEYNKKGSEYIAGRDTMPEAIRLRRESEIQDLQSRLQSFVEDSRTNLSKQQQDLLNPITRKVDVAVQAVGKENTFLLIFDTSAKADLSYFSVDKCVDVTNLLRTKLGMK
jgi:outer membrane protein